MTNDKTMSFPGPMEDRIDADDARGALAEMKAKGEKPIPLSKVKKRLGL